MKRDEGRICKTSEATRRGNMEFGRYDGRRRWRVPTVDEISYVQAVVKHVTTGAT